MKEFNISDVRITDLKDSRFVIPFQMHYKENGNVKSWDLIQVHDSVDIIIFNKTRKVFVCVKQFRPGVYINSIPTADRNNIDTKKYPAELGLTLEFCAGMVDKPNKTLAEIAQEEVREECGYKVSVEDLEKITTYRQGIGDNGCMQTVFYTEVTDSMKVDEGGGIVEEGEYIEVVDVTLEEAKTYLKKDKVNSPSSFLFGLLWFFTFKADKFKDAN